MGSGVTVGPTHKLTTALKLLARGDFRTFVSRTKAVLSPTSMSGPITQDISPHPRPASPRVGYTQKSRRKLLVCDRNAGRGGSQISLSEILLPLAKPFKDDGIDITLGLIDNAGPLKSSYHNIIQTQALSDFPQNMSLPDVYESDVLTFAAELTRLAPDVIYVNSIDMFPVIDAARISGIPTLWNIREAQNWRIRLADRHPDIIARALACLSYPEKVLFVSQSAKTAWEPYVPQDRAFTIKTSIPYTPQQAQVRQTIRKKLNVADDDVLFATIGTLTPAKGQTDIAIAMRQLRAEQREKLHWMFLGGGTKSFIQKLQQLWPPDHWQDQAHLIGNVDDCLPYYAAADYLVSSSLTEAMPRNILEAKTYGLPIISTHISGALEALEGYDLVEFYSPEDNIALSSLILEALNTRIPRIEPKDLGNIGYQVMLEEYETHIRDVLMN